MKKKLLKKIISALCVTAMSVPMASSVGALGDDMQGGVNHQQKTTNSVNKQKTMDSVQSQIEMSRGMIKNFLEMLERQSLVGSVQSTTNEVVEISDLLLKTLESLNKIYDLNLYDNFDDEDIAMFCECLKDFNKYMLKDANMGYINKDKIEKAKEKVGNLDVDRFLHMDEQSR